MTTAVNSATKACNRFPIYSWPYVRQALVDFTLANDYPREYDEWTEVNQRNYENARLQCAAIQAAGFAIPLEFRTQRHNSEFALLFTKAERLIGGLHSGVTTRRNPTITTPKLQGRSAQEMGI